MANYIIKNKIDDPSLNKIQYKWLYLQRKIYLTEFNPVFTRSSN